LVGVDADRRAGIECLRSSIPIPEVIILDDAYQHRKVKAGFYILITAYNELYCYDMVLPTGNLREPKKGASRANIVIVSKCPKSISEEERNHIRKKLKIKEYQSLFFTAIDYSDELVSDNGIKPVAFFKNSFFTLVTGIANPEPLVSYYKSLGFKFEHISFTDHHNFSDKEINELKQYEYIITTEKDYMRFLTTDINKERLWYQPITINFIDDKDVFEKKIFEFLG